MKIQGPMQVTDTTADLEKWAVQASPGDAVIFHTGSDLPGPVRRVLMRLLDAGIITSCQRRSEAEPRCFEHIAVRLKKGAR